MVEGLGRLNVTIVTGNYNSQCHTQEMGNRWMHTSATLMVGFPPSTSSPLSHQVCAPHEPPSGSALPQDPKRQNLCVLAPQMLLQLIFKNTSTLIRLSIPLHSAFSVFTSSSYEFLGHLVPETSHALFEFPNRHKQTSTPEALSKTWTLMVNSWAKFPATSLSVISYTTSNILTWERSTPSSDTFNRWRHRSWWG